MIEPILRKLQYADGLAACDDEVDDVDCIPDKAIGNLVELFIVLEIMGRCRFGSFIALWKDGDAVWAGTFTLVCLLAVSVASTVCFEPNFDWMKSGTRAVDIETCSRSFLQDCEGGPPHLICGVVELPIGVCCVDLWHLPYTIWRGGITGTLHVIGEVRFGMLRPDQPHPVGHVSKPGPSWGRGGMTGTR